MPARKAPDFRFETFSRALPSGRRTIYVRFLDEEGKVIATRSTGKEDERAASREVARLLRELDLAEIASQRKDRAAMSSAVDDRFSTMSIAAFVTWFWGEESHHVTDARAAGEPLSGRYLNNSRSYSRNYVEPYGPFRETPLSEVSFALVDRYFRALRSIPQVDDPSKTCTRAMADYIKQVVRGALNWAAARGYCEEIDFRAIRMPKREQRKRGLLTDEEVVKILALPTQELWRETSGEKRLRADVKPRPRLTGKASHGETTQIDVRMKAFVLMGPFLGFRRGEERGLRWGAVDLENGFVRVENNWVDEDKDKSPKRDSFGTLPIAPELEVVLWELRQFAEAIGISSPSDYVLFNPADPSRPASESTLRRGWVRIMRAIGISDAERQARNLVPHGTRHRFATKLIDAGLSPAEAAKMTRHRTIEMLEHYSGHVSAETMERAIRAVQARPGSNP